MNILFLDQSGNLGGAELCLLDIATHFKPHSAVALLSEGPFKTALAENGIPTTILTSQAPTVRKDSGAIQGIQGFSQLLPTAFKVARQAKTHDIIYVNTPKALIVGAIASLISRRKLVYHLHDILSPEHFSAPNRALLITLANRCASLVIANSFATRDAFLLENGRPDLIQVVYNGFDPHTYTLPADTRSSLRQQLQLSDDQIVIGHFSRLAPWKGQHILLDALPHCPPNTIALLVGDALFGETDYVEALHRQVETLHLQERVKFLGFRHDIPQLMAACDLVTHTSTAPEPFGRVIVEAMLSGRPIIAANAGGAAELINHGRNGWLCPPDQPAKLAELITDVIEDPQRTRIIAEAARFKANWKFDLASTNRQLATRLETLTPSPQVG